DRGRLMSRGPGTPATAASNQAVRQEWTAWRSRRHRPSTQGGFAGMRYHRRTLCRKGKEASYLRENGVVTHRHEVRADSVHGLQLATHRDFAREAIPC